MSMALFFAFSSSLILFVSSWIFEFKSFILLFKSEFDFYKFIICSFFVFNSFSIEVV